MKNFTIDGINIEIDAEPGIYEFNNLDFSGKSWLCRLLKSGNKQGLPVNGYDYNDFKTGVDIKTVLNEKNKIVVLDRYTMYRGAGIEELKSLSGSTLVLIDNKIEYNYGRLDVDIVFIETENKKIKVYYV